MTGSCYVTQAGLKFEFSCLSIWSPGITGMFHHAQLWFHFELAIFFLLLSRFFSLSLTFSIFTMCLFVHFSFFKTWISWMCRLVIQEIWEVCHHYFFDFFFISTPSHFSLPMILLCPVCNGAWDDIPHLSEALFIPLDSSYYFFCFGNWYALIFIFKFA
jgi:hypothetical protein